MILFLFGFALGFVAGPLTVYGFMSWISDRRRKGQGL